jgi:hypothetical protein
MWSNLHVLVLLVMMVSLIPVYGCLGFLPIFKGTARFGGLTTQGEMFGLAVYFGSCTSPRSRALTDWYHYHRFCVRCVSELC